MEQVFSLERNRCSGCPGIRRSVGIAINNTFCTMKASKEVRGYRISDGHNLKSVVKRELGIDIDKTYQKADWTRRPLTQGMINYAAMDAEVLIKLYDVFSPHMTS